MTFPQRLDLGPTVLRRLRIDDAEAVYRRYASDPEVTRFLTFRTHDDVEDAAGFCTLMQAEWETGRAFTYVMLEPGGPVPHILDWQSVPWGVVSLTETVGGVGAFVAARIARYEDMRQRVADSFATFAERIAPWQTEDLRLLGTSGTVTTLASVHLELPQYDRRAVDGLIVPAEAMRGIASRLSEMSPQERRALPCIGNERADLVVAGCAILEAILDIWPASRLGVADRGIREGILRSLIATDATGIEAQAALRRLRQDHE